MQRKTIERDQSQELWEAKYQEIYHKLKDVDKPNYGDTVKDLMNLMALEIKSKFKPEIEANLDMTMLNWANEVTKPNSHPIYHILQGRSALFYSNCLDGKGNILRSPETHRGFATNSDLERDPADYLANFINRRGSFWLKAGVYERDVDDDLRSDYLVSTFVEDYDGAQESQLTSASIPQ